MQMKFVKVVEFSIFFFISHQMGTRPVDFILFYLSFILTNSWIEFRSKLNELLEINEFPNKPDFYRNSNLNLIGFPKQSHKFLETLAHSC